KLHLDVIFTFCYSFTVKCEHMKYKTFTARTILQASGHQFETSSLIARLFQQAPPCFYARESFDKFGYALVRRVLLLSSKKLIDLSYLSSFKSLSHGMSIFCTHRRLKLTDTDNLALFGKGKNLNNVRQTKFPVYFL